MALACLVGTLSSKEARTLPVNFCEKYEIHRYTVGALCDLKCLNHASGLRYFALSKLFAVTPEEVYEAAVANEERGRKANETPDDLDMVADSIQVIMDRHIPEAMMADQESVTLQTPEPIDEYQTPEQMAEPVASIHLVYDPENKTSTRVSSYEMAEEMARIVSDSRGVEVEIFKLNTIVECVRSFKITPIL